MDSISGVKTVLNVSSVITTGLSLAALTVIIVFLVIRQGLSHKRDLVAKAIDAKDMDALRPLLGGLSLALEGLNSRQTYNLAKQEIDKRWKHNALIVKTSLGALVCFLCFLAFSIVQAPRTIAEPAPPKIADVSGQWATNKDCSLAVDFKQEGGTVAVSSGGRPEREMTITRADESHVEATYEGQAVEFRLDHDKLIYQTSTDHQVFLKCS